MAGGLRILPEPLRSIDSATFTGSLQKLGTPLNYACCLIKFVNLSGVPVTVSWDGVNNHDILPGTSITIYDVCSDAGSDRGLFVAQGTQFWVSGAASSGLIYLTAFHSSEF